MKKIFDELKSPKNLAGIFSVALLIVFYMLLNRIGDLASVLSGIGIILSPLIRAAVISYLLYHIVSFLRARLFGRMKRRRAAHVLSVVIALLLTMILVSLMAMAIIPQLVSSVSLIISNSESYIASLEDLLTDLDKKIDFVDLDTKTIAGYGKTLMDSVLNWVLDNSLTILGTTYQVGTGLVSGIIVFFLVIYMLLDCDDLMNRVSKFFRAFLKRNRYDGFHAFCLKADRVLMTFLGQNALDALAVGVLNFIFMKIMGMDQYAVLISALAGLTNFIPSVGPIIGMVINGLILIVSDPLNTVWFLIWSIVLQTVDGNIVKPILFRKGTSVKPLWVLVSIIVGGKIAGVAGMILGIPVFSLLSDAFNSMVDRRLINETNHSENID